MSRGPLTDGDHVAKYCGQDKHHGGQPLEVAFPTDADHISANWIEFFGTDIEDSLENIRSTCGLQLGVMGAYPVLPVRNVRQAIEAAGAIAEVLHTPEGTNVSHVSIAWNPRSLPVNRLVALQLSQQRWATHPARITANESGS